MSSSVDGLGSNDEFIRGHICSLVDSNSITMTSPPNPHVPFRTAHDVDDAIDESVRRGRDAVEDAAAPVVEMAKIVTDRTM